MKKLLTLSLSLMLLLGATSVSLANTLSVDVWGGGEVDIEQASETADMSQVAFGLEIPFDDFKLAASISGGRITDYYNSFTEKYVDVDTTRILVKGGFALVNDRQLRLDVTGGFYDRINSFDHSDYYDKEDSYYSLTVGVDAKLKLNRTAWIDVSYAYGLAPQGEHAERDYDFPEDDSYESFSVDSISLLSCKLNLLLTDQFGASIGYSKETIGFSRYDNEVYSALTVGAFYKF